MVTRNPFPVSQEEIEAFVAENEVVKSYLSKFHKAVRKGQRALVRARLDGFLGFLHWVQFSKPSLVCDFLELFRCFVDDFLIQYCQKLRRKDFMVKSVVLSKKRRGKREFLNVVRSRDLLRCLYRFFECEVDVPRVRIGKRQSVETLINEEALLFARFLRGERESWLPRIAIP